MMVYGGTPNGWVKRLGESKKGYKGKEIINFTVHHPFVLLFEKECLAMSDMVFKNNTPIVTKVRGEKVSLRDAKNSTISFLPNCGKSHCIFGL